jgi:Flp pilus assembly CpaF family ATPase
MESSKSRAIHLKKKESLDGEEEKYLVFNCLRCKENTSGNFYENKRCISCIMRNLLEYKKEHLSHISIGTEKFLIDSKELISFYTYLEELNYLKRIFKKIKKLRKTECNYKDFKCKNFNQLFINLSNNKLDFYDPVEIFIKIEESKKVIEKNFQNKDEICKPCILKLKGLIQDLYEVIQKLKLYSEFKTISNHFSKYSKIYSSLFDIINLQKKRNFKRSFSKKKNLVESYIIGRNKLFEVFIYEVKNETERFYQFNIKESFNDGQFYLDNLSNLIKNQIKRVSVDQIIPIEDLIKYYKDKSIQILKNQYNLSSAHLLDKISFFSALKILNLEKIFPLLIDDYIEELFLDKPWEVIYLNHQVYGRCLTDISLNKIERDRIKTFMRLYSNKRLDYSNPSIKFVLKNSYFYCRFTIDIDPINIHKFSFDIRKLNKNILTIQDLLKNKTLNPRIAAFLYFLILRRKNITVTGETDTGKTTLINALDLLTPKEFRKIYIENATESLNQDSFEKHQLKFKVDSTENLIKERFSKGNQIKRLLHRSPDLIYLGEILTKKEAKAMFHCLSAGLKGFQTIHSNDLDSLINRLLYHFSIDSVCLNDMDIIILMKKNFGKRRVISLNEINSHCSNEDKYYLPIFKFNPKIQIWDELVSIYDTNIVRELKKYEDLNDKLFYLFFGLYEEIFLFLLNSKKIEVNRLVDFFHNLSYFSRLSYDKLEAFWFKEKRSLE